MPLSPVPSPVYLNDNPSGLHSVTSSPQHRQARFPNRNQSGLLVMPLGDGEEANEEDLLRQRLTLNSQAAERQKNNLYRSSPNPNFSPTLDHFDNTPESASVPQFLNSVTPNPGSLEMFNVAGVNDLMHPMMPPQSTSPVHGQNMSMHGPIQQQLQMSPQIFDTQLQQPQPILISPQQQLMLQHHHHQQRHVTPEQFQQIYALEQAAALGGHTQVFQVLNGAAGAGTPMMPTTSDPSLAWQPVLAAPAAPIKPPSPTHAGGNRRSCLPPGRVDSFLSGPNEEGLFLCLYPDCGKYFKRRYNVRSHIQTHLCDRPYLCEVCQATFVRPHDLRRHEKCHQEEKPFKCPCGKTFTRHDALQRHRSRLICEGGIEIPGKPKKPPGKRGRPRKNAVEAQPAASAANATAASAAKTATAGQMPASEKDAANSASGSQNESDEDEDEDEEDEDEDDDSSSDKQADDVYDPQFTGQSSSATTTTKDNQSSSSAQSSSSTTHSQNTAWSAGASSNSSSEHSLFSNDKNSQKQNGQHSQQHQQPDLTNAAAIDAESQLYLNSWAYEN